MNWFIIKEIEINDFGCIKNWYHTISEEESNEIFGAPSGYGKSTIIKALRWVFGLQVNGYFPLVDLPKEEVYPYVRVAIITNYGKYEFVRGDREYSINENICKTLKEYREQIGKVFNMEYSDFIRHLFINDFLFQTKADLRNDLLDISNANDDLDKLKAKWLGEKFVGLQNNEIKTLMNAQDKQLSQNIAQLNTQKCLLLDLKEEFANIKERIDVLLNAKSDYDLTYLTSSIDETLSKYSVKERLEKCKNELAESFTQQVEIATLFNNYESFVKESIKLINNKVKALNYKDCRWQMFDKRKNGEIIETCEMIYKDKPFSLLSRGEQLKVAIILKRQFDKLNNFSFPLIIDNLTDIGDEYKIPYDNVDLEQWLLFKTNEKGQIDGLEKWNNLQ
jgi:energy-coupling factor transporter ATP-binding protein EcfA2